MKKFTYFFVILFIASMAVGQENENLQLKINKMQANFSRFSQQTEYFSKTIHSLPSEVQKKAQLKNALAVQKLDSVVYQEYGEESETWYNKSKDNYLYDSELNNTAWIEKDWDVTTNSWQDTAKIELEFNDAGQVDMMKIFTTDATSGEFVLDMKSEVFYNPEGRLDSILHYYVEAENTLVYEGIQIYHYNETGQLVQMDFTTTVEDEEGVSLQSMRIVYTYTDDGKTATSSTYFIDPEGEFLFSETENFYDDTGRLIATEYSSLSFLTFTLVPNSRNDYEYNEAGDVSVEIFSLWDFAAEEWIAEERYEYTYNDISFSEIIFPSYLKIFGINEDSYTYNYAISEEITFFNLAGEWVPFERSLYYYSEGTATSTKEIVNARVSVYPNPATENITVRWDKYSLLRLEVYHMTGAKVIEKQVSSGMKVPVSTLHDGIYLYKLIKDNQTIYSGKLIKR